MKQLQHIILGWYYLLRDTKKSREISKDRTLICNNCQHKNKKLNICNECKCFLPAKTRVEDAECPFGYWY